jgi:hypothetical protein
MDLCLKCGASPRLVAHLTLVHDVALRLVNSIVRRWHPTLDAELVSFGAASHDIGKAVCVDELSEPGSRHESVGRDLMLDAGISPSRARFGKTHATWDADEMTLEDLLVSLADQIWKGKRVEELEIRVARSIAANSGADQWVVFQNLADVLDEISSAAPARLVWQSRFEVRESRPPS